MAGVNLWQVLMLVDLLGDCRQDVQCNLNSQPGHIWPLGRLISDIPDPAQSHPRRQRYKKRD